MSIKVLEGGTQWKQLFDEQSELGSIVTDNCCLKKTIHPYHTWYLIKPSIIPGLAIGMAAAPFVELTHTKHCERISLREWFCTYYII